MKFKVGDIVKLHGNSPKLNYIGDFWKSPFVILKTDTTNFLKTLTTYHGDSMPMYLIQSIHESGDIGWLFEHELEPFPQINTKLAEVM